MDLVNSLQERCSQFLEGIRRMIKLLMGLPALPRILWAEKKLNESLLGPTRRRSGCCPGATHNAVSCCRAGQGAGRGGGGDCGDAARVENARVVRGTERGTPELNWSGTATGDAWNGARGERAAGTTCCSREFGNETSRPLMTQVAKWSPTDSQRYAFDTKGLQQTPNGSWAFWNDRSGDAL